MNNYTQQINETTYIKHFIFKVNNAKLENADLLNKQINKVIERIKKNYNKSNSNISVKRGTVDDDFIYNRFRVRITLEN